MGKEYEVIVLETFRIGYMVTANSVKEARDKVENPDRSYPETFKEYYDLEKIESVEEQS